MTHQPSWKTAIDVVLIPIALFRVVVGYSVDVAMAFKYPMALDGCADACASLWCALNCQLRTLLHIDLTDYFATGVDPVSSELGTHIRVMTGFYFLCVAPFMAALVYALWTRNDAIRAPAIVVGGAMAALMIVLVARNLLGTPPSSNIWLFLAYNLLDVLAPILILARVLPRPLFAAPDQP